MVYTASLIENRRPDGKRFRKTFLVTDVKPQGDYFNTGSQRVLAVESTESVEGATSFDHVINAQSVAGTNGDSNGDMALATLSGTFDAYVTLLVTD